MKTDKTKTIRFRRKREGKTDYRKRLYLLKSKKVRAVVRKSLKSIYVQFVEYEDTGDKVIASASSKDIAELGWVYSGSNTPCAYLVGLLAGTRAKEKNIKEAILDIGFSTPTKGSKIFAALKGIVDSGVIVPHNKEILPSEDRVTGKHISEYMKNNDKFTKYDKSKDLSEAVAAVKGKIKK
ncbi:50S ribosomal protein L18 [Candidatus Woesearchaeota archaeon]|nr:50S ribosomal protein L18 [Candidatus Woesearchaeota archaeon]